MERLSRLGGPDLVIVPGSASPLEDSRWLAESGLAAAIREKPWLGLCGGIFDSGEAVARLADWLLGRKGLDPVAYRPEERRNYQEGQLDLLAQTVRENLDLPAVYRTMEAYERGPSQ